MKVLMLSRPLDLRGTTLYTVTLCREMRLRGHHVAVLCEGGAFEEELQDERIRILHSPLHGRRLDRLCLPQNIMMTRAFAPEILHVQEACLADQGRWIARACGLPYTVTVHAPPRAPWRPSVRLRRIVTTTDSVAREMSRLPGIGPGLIETIPVGVAVERTVHNAIDHPLPAIPIIGTAGQLGESPDLALIVNAAKEVLARGIEAHFLIVGTGRGEAALRRQIRELNLVDCVTVSMARARFADLLDPIDIFISACGTEELPALTLLAMARGRPVLALPAASPPPTLRDGETVITPPSRTPVAVAESLVRLLGDQRLRSALARRALDEISQSHSRREMVDRTLKSYRDGPVADRSPSGR